MILSRRYDRNYRNDSFASVLIHRHPCSIAFKLRRQAACNASLIFLALSRFLWMYSILRSRRHGLHLARNKIRHRLWIQSGTDFSTWKLKLLYNVLFTVMNYYSRANVTNIHREESHRINLWRNPRTRTVVVAESIRRKRSIYIRIVPLSNRSRGTPFKISRKKCSRTRNDSKSYLLLGLMHRPINFTRATCNCSLNLIFLRDSREQTTARV